MEVIQKHRPPFQIGIVPIPGFALLSYACTVEPFRAANLLSGETLYQITHYSHDGDVFSSGQAKVEASGKIGDRGGALDLLLVVAGGDPFAVHDPDLTNWLGRVARSGVRIGGVSGGPVVLAQSGLMQGRRMTVHWEHAEALMDYDPSLLLERQLFVIDRDRVTCGGGTAPMDLAHALIQSHHGAVFARQVSDWFLHTGVRPSGDAQRGGLIDRIGTTSPPVLAAVETMESHLAETVQLTDLALIAGVSSRQLNRLFQKKFGTTTMEYYRGLRLDLAQRLLSQSPENITNIALATGFTSSSHFSASYKAKFGVSPAQTRR